MDNVVGKLIGVILIFLLLGVTPIYYTSIIENARDQEVIINSTRNLIDGVIDTGQLSPEVLEDYYADIASVSGYYNVTILHKVKVINPDPITGGTTTYTSYVVVDDIYNYSQGDEIIVTVKPMGETYYQKISRSLLNLSILREGITLAGKVR